MMIAAKIFFWILEALFAIGIVGSALVVLLTAIDDVRDLREKHDDEPKRVANLNQPASEAHW
jgi:hypothetical protein